VSRRVAVVPARGSRAVALTVIAATMTACTGIIVHERGLAKRIEVEKAAGPATLRLVAERRGPGRVEFAVLARRDIDLRRRIVYNTIEIRGEWNPNPLWELFEVPFGVAALAVAPFMYPFGMGKFEDSAALKADTVHNSLAFWLGLLNPAQSVVAPRYVRDPNVDLELFHSPVRTTTYAVSLPVAGTEVAYDIWDASGVLLQGSVTRTDDFGRVVVDGVPAASVRVQLRTGGQTAEGWLRPGAGPYRHTGSPSTPLTTGRAQPVKP